MNVVFRTDGSTMIGHGHVMRCLTLAEVLRARAHSVVFVCRKQPGDLCDAIAERGFAVARLSGPTTFDAQQTMSILAHSGVRADWLVTDHYGIDRHWHETVRSSVVRILAIDDLANRDLNCDLLLDQNLVAAMATRYKGRVPAHCRLLIGPKYALLQHEYAELHARSTPRTGPVRRVFVFFSGADHANLTGRTIAAFLRLRRTDIFLDAVVGPGHPYADAISEMAAKVRHVNVHSSLPTLAPLMAAADLAVGGSGTASWERLCLGLPALVVTMADNQTAVAAELQTRKVIHWLGQHDTVDDADLERALRGAIQMANSQFDMRDTFRLVDGRGAVRVCELMTSMAQ